MTLTLRIFLAYFLLVGTGLLLTLYNTYSELRPVVRQTSEEALVDTANLLAELAVPALVPEAGGSPRFAEAVERYTQRRFDARIWSHRKTRPGFIVYLTDANGRVVFHTEASEIGADYSDWIDVSRTLAGRYGARTTRSDPDSVLSSTMYVGAPVRYEGERVGVLTVGQPNRSVQPFLEHGRGRLLQFGAAILAAALLVGVGLSLWLTGSIRRLVHYVEQVRAGANARPPAVREPELARLAQSTESMRREIEGKRYVERYVHNLTHEMKSPLAAIRGAVEILQEPNLSQENRDRFLANIDTESRRSQRLVERLLALATLENRDALREVEVVDLLALVRDELAGKEAALASRDIAIELRDEEQGRLRVRAEALLLRQAISNLLDNAVEFCREQGQVTVTLRGQGARACVMIHNEGEPIPDYAQPYLFDRFYSLGRPSTGRKSTGLGLSFVREIAELHGGAVRIENTDDGVLAILELPAT